MVTHAHSDHAHWGCKHYLTSTPGLGVLKARVGYDSSVVTLDYGETHMINGVQISLHPAGHILGSSQVRLEYRGEVWVFSGDYNNAPDATCAPLEVVRCNTFISESTFGLPIFRWKPQREIVAEINEWWRANQASGRVSVLYAYSLGKAQRLMAAVDAGIGPIFMHGAMEKFIPIYREAGIALPEVRHATAENASEVKGKALLLAPPSAAGGPWLRKFGPKSEAFASGWMTIRGTRRRQSLDRGFPLSDHADWPGLLETIRATGAESVGVTHGYIEPMVRYLTEEMGLRAYGVPTRYTAEPLTGEAAPLEMAVED